MPTRPQKTSLHSQAFAAFSTAGRNHCAAAARFHARQETVCTCALDFGRLICAFHDKSYWPYRACYWAVSCKASFDDSNDPGGRKNQKPDWQVSTAGKAPAASWQMNSLRNHHQSRTGVLKPLRIGKTRDYHRFLTVGNKVTVCIGPIG